MIGQVELINRIDTLISEDRLPRFIILVGNRGSGRSTLISHIQQKFGGIIMNVGISVNDVRQAIIDIPNIRGDNVICTFKNADTMSVSAKNALLKIVEEPPKNAYFIMTVQSLNNVLETIKSRATIFAMLPYTPTEIGEYASKYKLSSEQMRVVAEVCETPGDVDVLNSADIIAFDEYVNTVVEYIAQVSGANSFSIARKIKFKDEDSGFDLILFFRAFISKCMQRMEEDVIKYATAIRITTKRMQELSVNGINRQNVVDMWILDIRKEWMI